MARPINLLWGILCSIQQSANSVFRLQHSSYSWPSESSMSMRFVSAFFVLLILTPAVTGIQAALAEPAQAVR